MRTIKSFPILLLALILLAACAAQPAAPTATSAPQESPTPRNTATPFPTNTPPPTLTPIPPTPTKTLPPTKTPVPTVALDYSEVKLIALAWYSDYDLLLGFQFPTSIDVNAANYRVTLEDKEYKCEVPSQWPHRLYCKGQGAKVLAEATVRIYPAGSTAPGFEKDVWVPYFSDPQP